MFSLLAQVAPETVADRATEAGKETWKRNRYANARSVKWILAASSRGAVVLVVGWILALIIAAMVAGVVRRLGIGRRFSEALADEPGVKEADVPGRIGKITFWLLMLFVLIAFFQTLGLPTVTEPLDCISQ